LTPPGGKVKDDKSEEGEDINILKTGVKDQELILYTNGISLYG